MACVMPKDIKDAKAWKRAEAQVVKQHGSSKGREALVRHIYNQMTGHSDRKDKKGLNPLEAFSDTLLSKAGPYIGPKGGKWADPKHTIPWKDRKDETTTGKKRIDPHGYKLGSDEKSLLSSYSKKDSAAAAELSSEAQGHVKAFADALLAGKNPPASVNLDEVRRVIRNEWAAASREAKEEPGTGAEETAEAARRLHDIANDLAKKRAKTKKSANPLEAWADERLAKASDLDVALVEACVRQATRTKHEEYSHSKMKLQAESQSVEHIAEDVDCIADKVVTRMAGYDQKSPKYKALQAYLKKYGLGGLKAMIRTELAAFYKRELEKPQAQPDEQIGDNTETPTPSDPNGSIAGY